MDIDRATARFTQRSPAEGGELLFEGEGSREEPIAEGEDKEPVPKSRP